MAQLAARALARAITEAPPAGEGSVEAALGGWVGSVADWLARAAALVAGAGAWVGGAGNDPEAFLFAALPMHAGRLAAGPRQRRVGRVVAAVRAGRLRGGGAEVRRVVAVDAAAAGR